jgi:multicomponent K+:H+ antiporter subunit G
MIIFTVLLSRPVLHELLIIVFIALTTPVTLMILVHAAVFRDRFESAPLLGEPRRDDPTDGIT